MQHIEEFISGWQCLHAARQKLHEPTFENIVFRLVEGYYKLPKSAKMKDYRETLEYFFVQYYNEFMFKCQTRSEECVAFIDVLKEFGCKSVVHKKDYQQLFNVLCSYYKGSVGGTKNGIPLLCLPEKCLRNSPSYHLDWHYDDVQKILLSLSLDPAKCAFCKTRPKTQYRLVGARFCPAGCLPACNRCEPNTETVSAFLQCTGAFIIPALSMVLREHLSNVFEVCSALSTDPVAALLDLQLSVEEHGKTLVVENGDLLSDNRDLRQKLLDLETVVDHLATDNEGLQSSLRNAKQDCRLVEQRFRQCESAFYDLRSTNEAVLRELAETHQRLQVSIQEQWHYYEYLKQQGFVS